MYNSEIFTNFDARKTQGLTTCKKNRPLLHRNTAVTVTNL